MADDRNCYSEHLFDVAENALNPLDDLFTTLTVAGEGGGEVAAHTFENIGPALLDHARREILGAIEMVEQLLGSVQIERAVYGNNLGMTPKTMIEAHVRRCPAGGDHFEEVDVEGLLGPHDPRPVHSRQEQEPQATT